MSREIKFRAFDKSDRRMLFSKEPEEQGKREFYPFVIEIGFSGWKLEDIILMQYINMNDKYGKPIYEDDIVTGYRKGSNSDRGYTGIIKWQNEQAGWIIKCDKFYLEILSLAQSGWVAEPYNIYQIDSFEVIGNIYEHPNLINHGN